MRKRKRGWNGEKWKGRKERRKEDRNVRKEVWEEGLQRERRRIGLQAREEGRN